MPQRKGRLAYTRTQQGMNPARPTRRSHRLTKSLVALFMISAAALARADDSSKSVAVSPTKDRYADHEKLVAESHKASVKLREEALRKTIAKDSAWPPVTW